MFLLIVDNKEAEKPKGRQRGRMPAELQVIAQNWEDKEWGLELARQPGIGSPRSQEAQRNKPHTQH